jgi:hypothetical protein
MNSDNSKQYTTYRFPTTSSLPPDNAFSEIQNTTISLLKLIVVSLNACSQGVTKAG